MSVAHRASTSVGVSSLILDANTVRVTFTAAPATDEGRVVVLASSGVAGGAVASRARARRVANQATTGGIAVAFDQTSWNEGDLVTISSDRSTFTRAATVLVVANGRLASGSGGMNARLFNSAGTALEAAVRSPVSVEGGSGVGAVTVAAGDYLQLLVFPASGGPSVFSDANGGTALSVIELV